MKTIVENSNKLSKYKFEDNKNIIIKSDCIDCGEIVICDLNSSNSTVYENVTLPDDWVECKYTFDGINWKLNPLFKEVKNV